MKAVKATAAQKIAEKESFDELCANKISRALELNDQIDFAKKELDAIKNFFTELLSKDESVQELATYAGIATLKTSNSYSVDTNLIHDLKKIFKGAYSEYVNEKISYGCQAKLRDLLSDGDYKHKEIVRSAVLIKTSKSVVFSPIKINKPRLVK